MTFSSASRTSSSVTSISSGMGPMVVRVGFRPMPLLPLVLLFIVVPIAELYVIFQVGDAIGVIPTIVLLAVDSLLGSVLLRSQGRSVWGQFNEAMSAGRVPHRELLDGVAVIFGGAFLITPGFITDIVGLLLLLPPTRAALRGFAVRRI